MILMAQIHDSSQHTSHMMLAVVENYKLLLLIIRQKMDIEGLINGVDWQKVADGLGRQTADGARRRWRNFRRDNGMSELATVTPRPLRARKQVARKLAKHEENEEGMERLSLCRETEADANLEASKADGTSNDTAADGVHKPKDAEMEWIESGEDEA